MKKILLFAILLLANVAAINAQQFVSFSNSGGDCWQFSQQSDTIIYDADDWAGVKIAVNNLKNDLMAVTGSPNAPIIVATVGKSKIANQYKAFANQLNPSLIPQIFFQQISSI